MKLKIWVPGESGLKIPLGRKKAYAEVNRHSTEETRTKCPCHVYHTAAQFPPHPHGPLSPERPQDSMDDTPPQVPRGHQDNSDHL